MCDHRTSGRGNERSRDWDIHHTTNISQTVILAAFYYQKATSVGFYHGCSGNKEIDIVVDYPDIRNILIEVKYEKTNKRDRAFIADERDNK